MTTKSVLVSILAIAAFSARAAHADEVDVSAFEYVDVIETVDGSIWKGVVTEQTPNVQYKIATADGSLHVIKAADVVKLTKQRNPGYRGAMPMPAQRSVYGSAPAPMAGGAGVSSSYGGGGGLPAPFVRPGLRMDPELAIVFPRGDLGEDRGNYKEAFAPGVRVGYETLMGNFGLTAGGLARFTYWRLSDRASDDGQAHWTLETQIYGRAALHVGRAAPYAGLSLGIDTNYVNYGDNTDNMTSTTLGFGMNLQTGIQVAASDNASFELGFDIHPGTDSILSSEVARQLGGDQGSVSYLALRLGASMRM